MNSKFVRVPRAKGSLVSDNGTMAVDVNLIANTSEFYSYFNRFTGELSISIPGVGTATTSGFLTKKEIGHGPEGRAGNAGATGDSGYIGSVGINGATGPRGFVGERGDEGETGLRGLRGLQGPAGARGATGYAGDDGVIPMFIQVEEPDQLEFGTIWVKIQEVEMLEGDE